MPQQQFFAIGAVAAAVVVVAVAEGKAGFRDLGARIVRWRVPWYWYLVALGLPLVVRLSGQSKIGSASGPG